MSPPRLLVADDDEVDRMTVRRHLADYDVPVEIVEASDAQTAVRIARSEPLDCAIVDVNMPGRDGMWVVREIRGMGSVLPIIVLTGHGDEETAVSLMKAGATDYIAKGSIDATTMRQRLRQALRVGRAEIEAAQARREREETEQLLRLIVDSLPALVAYVDRGERYRWGNRCYESWLGASREAMLGKEVRAVVGDEAYDRIAPHIKRALGGEVVSFEDEVRYPTGKRWIEASYVPHVTSRGVEGYVGLVHDVSERRRQEEERARQRDFEKELVGIVSHDLRNPISVMMMAAQLLQRREDLPADAAKTLARIVSNGDRAVRMIRDLLDFTQARVGGGIPVSPAVSNLHDIVRQIVEEARITYAEREFLVTATGDGGGEWDGDRVAQLATNLVANAATYSPPGSTVEVTTEGEGATVRLKVFNTGAPIPASVLPTIFEPFKRGRTDRSSDRSIGLGLYIVKQLVEAHGGAIDVTSLPNIGTTFTVELPRRTPPASQARVAGR